VNFSKASQSNHTQPRAPAPGFPPPGPELSKLLGAATRLTRVCPGINLRWPISTNAVALPKAG